MVLYEVISREPPFEDQDPADIESLVRNGSRPDLEAVPPDCPPKLLDLMIQCWAQDPKKRPTFPDILEVLMEVARELG
jgi:sterile alpha motif and leucine zipper-containing kinase AZK